MTATPVTPGPPATPEPRAAPGGVPLPAAFFDRPPLAVARDLLGAVVVRGQVAVSLTEVEAYDGAADPASHASRGRTRRNDVMFGPPGRAYVYFTYGVHWCVNVVCGPGDAPAAVLLRAGAVVAGLDVARGRGGARADWALARGPACLTQVLDVDGGLNGAELTRWPGELAVLAGTPVADEAVRWGPRVGIRVATERPWRCWIEGARSVSGRRVPGTRRPPSGPRIVP